LAVGPEIAYRGEVISRAEDHSPMHKFKVGQIVSPRTALRSEMIQVYEIVRHMPEEATGMRQYRIKGVTTGGERVVPEIEITAYEPPANAAPGRR
jgi:hypothetical protein